MIHGEQSIDSPILRKAVEEFKKSVRLNVDTDRFLRDQFNFRGVNYELNPNRRLVEKFGAAPEPRS